MTREVLLTATACAKAIAVAQANDQISQ